jgi:hypothetical protein
MLGASSHPVRHDPFGHLYLSTIMMILVLVTATSFIIMLLFSLPSCLLLRLCTTPFSTEGVGVGTSSPYSLDTSPDTDPRSGYCTLTRTFHSMCTPSFSASSDVPFIFLAFVVFFHPILLPPPTVAAASRSTLVDAGTGQAGLAPGLSPCVPPRRTQ